MLRKNQTKKHPKYYAIPAYQILAQKTDAEMASLLNISVRTYRDKIEGWSDFSHTDSDILCKVFKKNIEEIFLTKNVSNRHINT